MNLLANCPFCGADIVSKRRVTIDGAAMIAISCLSCGCIGPQFFPDSNDAEGNAITLWNERKEPIKNDDSKDNKQSHL